MQPDTDTPMTIREMSDAFDTLMKGTTMFHEYPKQFPTAAIMYLAPLLRGTIPDNRPLAINAAYTVVSFGLGQIVPVGGDVVMGSSVVSAAQCADMLEAASKHQEGENFAAMAAVPWEVIVPVLVKWLDRFLERRLG